MSTGAVRAPHLDTAAQEGKREVVDLDAAGSTPILREYRAVKAQHPDHIVLGRMGDFYELLGGDAEIAAPILGVTLTSRNFGKAGRLPMCGVPHHSAAGYIRKLLDAGQSVALWDQVGEVISGKLVRREVTRVLSPGTRVDADYIDEGATARCSALNITSDVVALACLDASTGELEYLEIPNDVAQGGHLLADTCNRLGVAEIVLPHNTDLPLTVLPQIHRTRVPQSYFDNARAGERIAQISPSDSQPLRSAGGAQLGAVGAVLAYAQDLHLRLSSKTLRVRRASTSEVMQLDAATIANLELLKPLNADGSPLVAVLDHTVTPMGARALRRYLVEPLVSAAAINTRLSAVTDLTDDSSRERIRTALRPVRDLERLLGRCAQAIATPRDLGAIRDALKAIPSLKECVAAFKSELLQGAATDLVVPEDVLEMLDAKLVDEPPLSVRDGGAIRKGADAELDEMHASSSGARSFIAKLEEAERERTGIKSLKVGYNRVFGYYIELPVSQKDAAPAEYVRKQTLANAERFVTADLKDHETIVLSARERSVARELEILRACVDAVCAQTAGLSKIAQAVTTIDVLQSLAHTATAERWTRPVVDESVVLDIEQGRHPIVERSLGPGRFVANDCTLDAAERIMVLTGPNMAGKSTYLRQVALIVLLAQIGSYIPGKRARIGICDRVFTRVGAHDDLARGMSTFMLEMSETAHIVRNASGRSLVVLDEIGRGTSTYDGLSIAQALLEYIHDAPGLNCRTLFATHYHELTALERELPRVVNARVDVLESGNEITFLHHIVAGGADRSYGIHVAKLAGLPSGVLQRAQVLLEELERAKPLTAAESPNQLDLLVPQSAANQPVVDELIQLDVESLTPIAALNKLAELREKLSVNSVVATRQIALLDPTVANAIAAGEVVERPASVVKELCENSIDAGSTSIDVELSDGGMTRIAVIDDGIGIPAGDLLLAVARHATSKISSIDDLSAISTLGFRGEALASMAAVSQLTIRSATANAQAGRELTLRGGEAAKDQAAPAVQGTTIELADLFFNTPARLQFLKGAKTEAARAVRIVSDLALTRPDIRFSCRIDGRLLLQTSGESLRDAIAAVFGKADAEAMIDVAGDGEVSVSGFLGQPHRHRGQRNAMVTIVNTRRVHNRALTFAVENAFRSLIPTGRYPICVLRIDVAPETVDVNVHPAKTEVRFANEGAVFASIERACWNALNHVTIAPRESVVLYGQDRARAQAALQFFEPRPPAYDTSARTSPASDKGTSLKHLAPLHALGQVNDKWISASTASGLVVVDPHAAHEKLLYTKLISSDSHQDVQLLLMPVVVELTPSQMAQVANSTEPLQQWGIEVEEFGPTSLRCRAVPVSTAKADLTKLIPLLIDELTDGSTDAADRKHKAAALVACHSAVRLGDRLGLEEQQALLDQLVDVPTATTCPHGRPTVFVLDDATLRRAFDRPII